MTIEAPTEWRTRLIVAVVIGVGCVGCASTRTIDAGNRDELAVAFITGHATLPCASIACAGGWGWARPSARHRYGLERWHDLAELVLEVGYDDELPWFYLGTAAEKLGYREAALFYYRHSVSAAERGAACLFGSCEDFDLPGAAQMRIQALTATTARQAQ